MGESYKFVLRVYLVSKWCNFDYFQDEDVRLEVKEVLNKDKSVMFIK